MLTQRILTLAGCLAFYAMTLAGAAHSSPLLIGTTDTLTADAAWADAVSGINKNPNSYGKNDHLFNVNWLVDTYVPTTPVSIPENLTLLGKYEKPSRHESWKWVDTAWGNDSPYFDGDLTGTWGYWSEVSQDFDGPVYFSLKAGNEFALYLAQDFFWFNDEWVTGSFWNTYGMNKKAKDLSHISFWTAGADPGPEPPAPVPEPATLVLVGLGVLGLSRAFRKKRC